MDQSAMQIWESMGIVVKLTLIFILVMSIYMLYVVIERIVTYARGSKQSYSYVMALRDYLSKRRVDEALSAARRYSKSPVAKVVESGLVAFNQGREALTGGGLATVGPAIAEALYATAIGLGVAIPAAMAFNYFTGRVESFVVDMSDVSSEFIDYVLKEGRS